MKNRDQQILIREASESEITTIESGSGWQGVNQGLPYGDRNSDAHPYRIRGLYPRAGWSHQMLTADPQVYRGHDMQALTLSSLAWDIIPPSTVIQETTEQEQFQTDFIRSAYQTIDGGFTGAAVTRPMTSRIHGFSISEIVLKIDESTGLWTLDGLYWIAPWSVRSWVLDLSGHALGVIIHDEQSKDRFIAWSKLLYDGQMFWGRNYEGIGVTRPLRYYWDHKTQMLVDDATARERASSGIPYASPPIDRDRETYPDEYADAKAILEGLVYDGDDPAYYVSPAAGWDIGVNYLDQPPDPTPMLHYVDHQIASQMGDTITNLGATEHGSRAVGSEMRLERWSMLTGLCAIKAHNIDQQVHRLIYEMNGWKSSRMCKTVATGLQDQMLYRRLLEYLTAEKPENPLLDATPAMIDQIIRALGLSGV